MDSMHSSRLDNIPNTMKNNKDDSLKPRNNYKLLAFERKQVHKYSCFHTCKHHQQLEPEQHCFDLFQLQR